MSGKDELTLTGNKKIDTLRKEFNKKFPYLRLDIYYSYARNQGEKGKDVTKAQIPGDKTFASVCRANSGGKISISGNRSIRSLEKEFDTVFGLYVQVCYTMIDGSSVYSSLENDDSTLSALSDWCEKWGPCKKGAWK